MQTKDSLRLGRPKLCYKDSGEVVTVREAPHRRSVGDAVLDVGPAEDGTAADLLCIENGRTHFRVCINTVSMDHKTAPFASW